MAETEQEQELARLRERLDMLSAASFEGILIHVDGVVIDANQRLAELLGYEHSEVIGANTMRLCVAPEDMPEVLRRMANRVEGEYVITGVRKDGSRFRAELLSKQGRLGDRPVRVVAVRDVTERERTSALLRESEGRLRELAEGAFDFLIFSRAGVVIQSSGAVERVLGFRAEQLVGRKVVDLAAPSSRPFALQVIAEQRLGKFEVDLVSAQGEHVPVEIVAVMSTLDGEPVRVSGLRDLRETRRLLEERRKLEQQVERAQRLDSLGVLAGGIAHDFNNLLVGILGNAEFLLERLTDATDRGAAVSVLNAGKRAAALTKQMLAYAGQRDLAQREPVDLGDLWRELRTLLNAVLSKKAHIEISIGPDSVVLAERATIMQVLMNLLTNASDALEDKAGTIEVRTRRVRTLDARWDHAFGATVGPGDLVLVEVKDTGIGMNEATLGRVFEPFFSTKEKGHGLGLAACLGIVASHGGAILVESELGKGSTFSVLLPAGQMTLQPVVEERATSTAKPCKVLVIDDEALVRLQIRRSLELRGYTVEEAVDGKSGLGALDSVSPEIVILDMTMPDFDGAEVVRRIREKGSRVPVLISSGYLDASIERKLASGSFQGFLRKPYGVAELIAAIEHARGQPIA